MNFECHYCKKLFTNPSEIQAHEEEHANVGDVTIKELEKQTIKEKNRVIKEIENCKDCDRQQSALSFCDHHCILLKMLMENIR